MVPVTENYCLPSSTLDDNVLLSIRQAVADFHQRCGVNYVHVELDEVLYNECCQVAIQRGFPMDGDFSMRPYMAMGAAMATIAFAHLPDHATRMWICLFATANTCIDDRVHRGHDAVHLYPFNERFVNSQPQGDPVLNAFDAIIREAHGHFSPLVANLIVTSSLDYMSSLLVEDGTMDMQISKSAPLYPAYTRLLSGLSSGYGLWTFPSTIPYQKYIQVLPDLMIFICSGNDIISFYKEECTGEDTNYISLMADSRGLTKLGALHVTIDETVQAHHNILECLRPHPEAYEAYASFFKGYFKVHAVLKRYKMREYMLDE